MHCACTHRRLHGETRRIISMRFGIKCFAINIERYVCIRSVSDVATPLTFDCVTTSYVAALRWDSSINMYSHSQIPPHIFRTCAPGQLSTLIYFAPPPSDRATRQRRANGMCNCRRGCGACRTSAPPRRMRSSCDKFRQWSRGSSVNRRDFLKSGAQCARYSVELHCAMFTDSHTN